MAGEGRAWRPREEPALWPLARAVEKPIGEPSPHRRPVGRVGLQRNGRASTRWLNDANAKGWLIRQGENAARRI
jgi:hypothetical protein